MNKPLKNKFGVVAGGGYGIGRAIAIHLARQGADLLLTARSADELDITKSRIEQETGITPLTMIVDVNRPQDIDAVSIEIENKRGSCDFLISTVFGHIGEDEGKTLEDVEISELDSFARSSIVGNWLLLRSLAPQLRKAAGRAVFMVADWGFPSHNVFTSGRGADLNIGSEAFVSAKYALHGLIVSADRQLGLSCCGIYPGIVASKRSDGSGYYDIDDTSALSDEAYADGWGIPLLDLAYATEFCLKTVAIPKSVLIRPPTTEYDGLHI